MVEVRDLLAQMEVFEERGPSHARLKRMVGIWQTHTLSRGQEIAALGSGLGTVLRRLAGRREYGRSRLVSAVGTWHYISSRRRRRRRPVYRPYPKGRPVTAFREPAHISPDRVSEAGAKRGGETIGNITRSRVAHWIHHSATSCNRQGGGTCAGMTTSIQTW